MPQTQVWLQSVWSCPLIRGVGRAWAVSPGQAREETENSAAQPHVAGISEPQCWCVKTGLIKGDLCWERRHEVRCRDRCDSVSPSSGQRRGWGGGSCGASEAAASMAPLLLQLWIPPAFGCRPEYDNGLEEIVFGFEPWIIVVNLAMPFSIFYRMHAAASLFEVYCKI